MKRKGTDTEQDRMTVLMSARDEDELQTGKLQIFQWKYRERTACCILFLSRFSNMLLLYF